MALSLNIDLWNKLDGKKIFLTGGTGFFGRSLLDFVEETKINIHITVLTRDAEKFKSTWSGKLKLSFVEGDITSFEFPDDAFDYIFHFATPASQTFNSQNPMEMFSIIVDGSKRVYEFANHCKAKSVLLASSGAAYGKQPGELSEVPETYLGAPSTIDSTSAYGEGKRVAELMGCTLSRKYGFDFKIARCFAFLGPHLDLNGTYAIGNFIRDALRGNDIIIKGDGTPLRSYLYSDDLVIWLIKILLDGQPSKIYNVGSDAAISIKELAEKVVSTLKVDGQIMILGKKQEGVLPERYIPSIQLARYELGLDIYTTLEEGILKSSLRR